jgi:hypothetical protein
MRTEDFKKFLRSWTSEAIKANGGIEAVREMHRSMDMVRFLTGWVCGRVYAYMPECRRNWEDTVSRDQNYTLEEVRRVADYVRLAIETESTTS